MRFVRRSSAVKLLLPKSTCTIPVLSARYSTFPALNSSMACHETIRQNRQKDKLGKKIK